MWLQSQIKINDSIQIIWWEPVGFTNIQSTYIGTDETGDLLFNANNEIIKGSQSFWVKKDKIKSNDHLLLLQRMLVPTQLKLYEFALKTGQDFKPKIKSTEIERMMETIKAKHKQLNAVIEKYGFDPNDTSWIESLMPETNLERDWYAFIRESKEFILTNEQLNAFNAKHGYTLDLTEAKELFKKRMRYLIGAFTLRWSGEKDQQKWKEQACAFESKFAASEQAMNNWYLSKNGDPQLVIVKEPIQFYPGRWFLRIIERIPEVFTNHECKYVKPGVVLEVFGFDRENKYIDLDFTADIRKKIFDVNDRVNEDTYSILLKNTDIDKKLESIEHL